MYYFDFTIGFNTLPENPVKIEVYETDTEKPTFVKTIIFQ